MRMLMRAAFLAGMLVQPVTGALVDEVEGDHEPASRLLKAEQREADHERARRALEAGEIVPLDRILQQVQAHYSGTVIEIELARQEESWVYEVELLADDGRLLTLWIDAKSTQLLREVRD